MKPSVNKAVLLVTSVATIALLGVAALQENRMQEWRRLQRRYAAALPSDRAASFRVQLRQIVVPGLGHADRCVTCHVGMAPGEAGIAGDRVFGKHPVVPHDPADFGCTVCHGGQGRATESDDAHGTVHFWPEPMIPAAYAYAGCGSCHMHLAVPNLARLEAGRAALERADCLACHRIDGRGGTVRPGGAGGIEGIDLSRVGAVGFDPHWYERHVAKAEQEATTAWRASFRALGNEERAAIEAYLSSRVGAPGLIESKALFHSLGCRGCHKIGGVGGDDGPDLTLVGQRDPGRLDFTHVPGERSLEAYFKEHFRAPAKVVPGSLMPELGLTEDEVGALTFYTLSLRRSEVSEAYWPTDRIRAERFGTREFATDGATLYGTFCSACHGARGEGMRYAGMSPFPSIGNEDFLRIASDAFLGETIRRGRPGRRMPAWGGDGGTLTDEEIGRVVAHLRSITGVAAPAASPEPRRWVPDSPVLRTEGAELYAANCARCHGANGEGGEGVALNNPVLLASASDRYLIETIRVGRRGTSMNGFETSTSVSRSLAPSEMERIVAHLRTWEVQP